MLNEAASRLARPAPMLSLMSDDWMSELIEHNRKVRGLMAQTEHKAGAIRACVAFLLTVLSWRP
jgi:hypothetical protein